MTLSHHPSTRPLRAAPILDYLRQHLAHYPFDPDLDRVFIDELLEDFPHLDLLEEIKRYRWFHDDQTPNDRARLALRKWLAASQRWR